MSQSGSSKPRVAVIDYGIGNLHSAHKGFERAGAEVVLTSDSGEIARADGVVLPGVGHFGSCIGALDDAGLREATVDAAGSGRPFIGICVGMQMLYEGSDEAPGVAGLGVLPGTLQLLPDTVKRPQMQWNRLDVVGESPLLAGLSDPAWVYFVHSYAARNNSGCVATCDYGGPVVAAVDTGSVWATQFHPEKSSRNGLQILENFVAKVANHRNAGAAR